MYKIEIRVNDLFLSSLSIRRLFHIDIIIIDKLLLYIIKLYNYFQTLEFTSAIRFLAKESGNGG